MVEEIKQTCPYCGEPIHLLADEQMLGEVYIEDCEVCCRPIVIELTECAGALSVQLKAENDT